MGLRVVKRVEVTTVGPGPVVLEDRPESDQGSKIRLRCQGNLRPRNFQIRSCTVTRRFVGVSSPKVEDDHFQTLLICQEVLDLDGGEG